MVIMKSFTFDAAHKLIAHGGKCANLHGHTYKMEVFMKENASNVFQSVPPFIIDFGDLSDLVKGNVVNLWDHQLLNDVLNTPNPTAEFMCMFALNRLRTFDKRIFKVRVWETPTCYAEVAHEAVEE